MSKLDAPARERVRDRVLLVVILTVFLDLVGFGITIPLLPFYVKSMSESRAADITGLIIGSYSLAQALATPWLGRLSDRYGRRVVILVSLLGNAASMVLFALAVHYKILALLFISRALAGATAGNLGACQAAIADVTERNERATAMGRLGAGIGLGLIVGPFIGGQTGKIAPWAPPVAAAAMAMLDLVLAAILMPETRGLREEATPGTEAPKPSARIWDLFRDWRMASVLTLFFLTFTAMTCLNVALPLLSHERFGWTGVQVGYMFGAFGLTSVLIQGFLMKRISKRFDEVTLVVAAGVFIAAGMLFCAAATYPWMFIVGNVLIGVGVSINNPVISALASKMAPAEMQGAVLGYAQASGSWARTIWPPMWGFAYEHLASVAPFIGSAIASVAMSGVAASLRGAKAPASSTGANEPTGH